MVLGWQRPGRVCHRRGAFRFPSPPPRNPRGLPGLMVKRTQAVGYSRFAQRRRDSMVSFAGINWLAVLVGVVASNALGVLWYGPLFSKPWLQALGQKEEELQSRPR